MRVRASQGRKMIRLRLKDHLEDRGLTMMWLSERTGIRYATLNAMANGRGQTVNLYYLDSIMDALEIQDVNILLEKYDY